MYAQAILKAFRKLSCQNYIRKKSLKEFANNRKWSGLCRSKARAEFFTIAYAGLLLAIPAYIPIPGLSIRNVLFPDVQARLWFIFLQKFLRSHFHGIGMIHFFGSRVFIFRNRTTREVPNISNWVLNFPIMPEILFSQYKYQILLYQNNPKYTWWNHLEFPVNVIIVVSERHGRINMSIGFENYFWVSSKTWTLLS